MFPPKNHLASCHLEAFVREFEHLDRDIGLLRVEIGGVVFGGPSPDEVPARHLLALAVEQDDRAILALNVALDCSAMPVVELPIVGHAPLELDVAEFIHSR